ncbi:hypothetical protein MNBD_UNCLBAC01-231 [hydrothermal vent metagenome]|uniref:Uncharacterized protein n=1 Tax=hydrothermal vent metagenome TaxID=652676 RepID=A0A3B1CZC9_9ZZZZ
MKERWQNEQQKAEAIAMAVEQTADHVVITDKDGIIEYVNSSFEDTTGYTAEEALGNTPRILKSGKHSKEFYQDLWNIVLSGNSYRGVITNKKKNGELYYADQTITAIKNDEGKITHFVAVWKDITERIIEQEKSIKLKITLEVEKLKLEQILDFDERITAITNIDELVDFVVEKASRILKVDKCSLMLLDEDTGELCIKSAKGLDSEIIKQTRAYIGFDIAGFVVREGEPILVKDIETDARFHRNNKPTYHSKSFLSVPIQLEDKVMGVVNVTDKVSAEGDVFTDFDLKIFCTIVRQAAVAIENSQLYKELKYLVMTDPLTNLYNYRHFMRTLDAEIERVKYFKHALCLLLMDMDDFKLYNDCFGRLEGDALLKKIGKVLEEEVRKVDIVCRYAADEFVVILPEVTILEAVNVAEKIRQRVENIDLKKKMMMSIGVVQYREGMTRHDVLLKANTFLSEAKKNGKNRVFSLKK